MNTAYPKEQKFLRPIALLLSVLLGVPFFSGCSSHRSSAPLPPVDDTRGGSQTYPAPGNQPQAKKGLSTKQKVAILAGAAALYYLDAQGRPHWVTPPSGGIQVPESEAQQYRDFQGYNNRSTGRDLTNLAPSQA